MLKTLRQWFINGPKEQQHMHNLEKSMSEMREEIISLREAIANAHEQDLLAIANGSPGDIHPRFRNLRIRVYDIEYARKVLTRMEAYKDQPEPVSNQKQ